MYPESEKSLESVFSSGQFKRINHGRRGRHTPEVEGYHGRLSMREGNGLFSLKTTRP